MRANLQDFKQIKADKTPMIRESSNGRKLLYLHRRSPCCCYFWYWSRPSELPVGTLFSILPSDLWLVKKSASWVPMSCQRSRWRRARRPLHLSLRGGASWAMSSILYGLAVPHTPETKTHSKQWLKKVDPGSVKVEVCTSEMAESDSPHFI